MRYERKYRIENLTVGEVLAVVRTHPLGFRTEFPDRWVNNIYLDTPDLQALRDKLNGVENRVKFRIRWYGPDMRSVKHPVLESKIRVGELGEKTARHLPGFYLDSRQTVVNYVREHVSADLQLEPVLLNRYFRSYFISQDGNFRLTVDTQMEYRNIGPGFFSMLNEARDPALIVEVKYDETLDERWELFSARFPFPESDNSKYVNGMFLTGRGL